MRSFTKKGYIKHKKSNDEKVIERLLSNGWTEVGVEKKPKTKKTKK
jgi:hypothetical protein|tara:strand:+ start:1290 stop:1427 length:138 start_codon:yes stop_codon:yes gene_type:complete